MGTLEDYLRKRALRNRVTVRKTFISSEEKISFNYFDRVFVPIHLPATTMNNEFDFSSGHWLLLEINFVRGKLIL